jgi:2-dehydro-3-deoxyglucarate aldolase
MNGLDLKRKLRNGEVCWGAWLMLTDPMAPEIMSHVGFDWLLIDAEHSPLNVETLQTMVLMTQRGGTPAIVRVPWNEPGLIKQVLDLGAEGVMVPMVNSAEDARRVVDAARYPPGGRRGWGPRAAADFGRRTEAYSREANERINVFIQIEHIEAVRNLDEILAVPGLDGAYIGPGDLSFSMGMPGDWYNPELIATIQAACRKIRAAGVAPGGAADGPVEHVLRWLEWGAQFVTVGADYGFMQEAAEKLLGDLRRAREQRPG